MQRIKKHKLFITIVALLILIGFICGLFYFFFVSKSLKTNIYDTIKSLDVIHYNAILKDLIIMSLLLISSFLIIGIPLSIFYLFYESFSLGFLTITFISLFPIKGIIFIILYLLINKLLTLFLMIIFIYKIITISRLSIGFIIYKKDLNIQEKIIKNFKNSLYIIIFVLIINILLYFISPILFALLK